MFAKTSNSPLLLYCMVSMLTTGCFSVKSSKNFYYEKVDTKTYSEMLKDSSNYTLIDVRTAKEYQKSHIPNAINCSYLDFHLRQDVDTISRNRLVFVYCHTCHRSPLAARKMKKMGFRKVYDLKKGFQQWEKTTSSTSVD